jgi:hypothetical protein
VLSCPVIYLRLMAPTQCGNLRPPPKDCTNSAVLRERLSAGLHSRASPYTYGAGSGTVIMNRV